METLLLYFLKVNGLLIVFYLAYYLFLRKETFFQSNRWFLLLGIISSFVLPLITFTEIIWIDSEPIIYNTNTQISETNFQDASTTTINWEILFTCCYIIISCLFLFKIGIELISFLKILKKGTKNKEGKIVLVETVKNQNPFSFFNYLVYNKSNFSEEELNMIIIHEKIHIEEKHSYDVLITKLLCIILWINPIAWFYKKAILENLEFIADFKTSKITNNTYQYQKTLLKVVVCNNKLSITNQFYQSLIKKRIVMLNTNQSNKKNIWKYSLVVPFLIAFIFLFQIETKAQVKENSINTEKKTTEAVVIAVGFITDKNATDAEMKSDTEELKKQGIDYKFSKVRRNKKGEITAIKIEFNDNKGNKGVKEFKSDKPIEPIYFSAEDGNIGFTNTPSFSDYIVDEKLSKQFGTEIKVKMVKPDDQSKTVIFIDENEASNEEMNEINPKFIKTMDVSKNGEKRIIRISTKNSAGIHDDTEIFINGKKVSQEEFDELEQNEIALMNVSNINSKKRIEIQKKAKEEVEKEMEKINIEWQEASKIEEMKAHKAEMEKMKAELAKSKAELEKMKAELKKKN